MKSEAAYRKDQFAKFNASHKESLTQLFEKFDADGSGDLDAREMQRLVRSALETQCDLAGDFLPQLLEPHYQLKVSQLRGQQREIVAAALQQVSNSLGAKSIQFQLRCFFAFVIFIYREIRN